MIGSTPLPGAGDGSGPAYDDTAIVERLGVLEANRSASPEFRPELRSRVGGLTVDSQMNLLFPNAGYLAFDIIHNASATYIPVFVPSGTVGNFIGQLRSMDYSNFLEVLVEAGQLVVRPANPDHALHIVSSAPDGVLEAFSAVDDSWFGQDVYPRLAGTYDTTSTNVRLTGPEGAYAPGSGLSVSTALEALKRLHHQGDLLIEDRNFWSGPDGSDPVAVTLRQIGASVGQVAHLVYPAGDDVAQGDPLVVDNLDETVRGFIQRIPGVAGTFDETNSAGRTATGFYVNWDIPWQFSKPTPFGGYGFVRLESDFGQLGEIRRVLTRVHSDEVFLSADYDVPGETWSKFVTGRLSSIVGQMLTQIQELKARIAELEARP